MTTLPPKSRRALWAEFAKWVLGIPLVLIGAGGLIWLAYWLTGGSMMTQTEMDIGTILFWLVVIALLYPAMVWVWSVDLRDGLKALRAWEALRPEEQVAALAAGAQTPATPRRRQRGQP